MTDLEIMEPEMPYASIPSGVQIVPRPHSAPSRKILQPEIRKGHAEDRKSSSSPVTAQLKTGKNGQETEIGCIHIGRVNLEKDNTQFKKVLPPQPDERNSDSVFNEKGSNKVFDTGTNYGHSADGYTEPMPDIKLLKEDELPLPSLPFEIVYKNGRQLEDEEGMEVEDMNVDHEEEVETVVGGERLKTPAVTQFRQGFTVYGTKDALVDMVLQMVALPDEETGIFTKESLWFLSSEDRREVNRKKVLGRGTFGKVNLYVHDKTDYVIKQITSDFQRNEVLLTAKLNSPYIIQCYGMVVRNKIPEIIMEYGGQSMLQMARLRKFQDRDVWDLAYQGLCGLEYLEEHQICHHDIKPENILLMVDENQFLLKITDFGAAKLMGEANDMVGWTVEYLSPERAWVVLLSKFPHQLKPTGLEETEIIGKADMFAFALSLMYAYERSHVMMKYITKGDNFYRDADKQPELQVNLMVELCSNLDLALSLMPKSVSTDMRFVLNKMLQGDVNKRCSATEAKNWMNFLSNLAIQQRDKGLKIQADCKTPEVCTAQTQTKPTIKEATAPPVRKSAPPTRTSAPPNRKSAPPFRKSAPPVRNSAPPVKQPSPPAVGASPTDEEEGWARDCNQATMATMAHLPSGLKSRMVKRKLLRKLAAGKKLRPNDYTPEQDHGSNDTNGASSPDVIVIDDTEEKPVPVCEQSEEPEVKLGHGNIPNFLLDMTC